MEQINLSGENCAEMKIGLIQILGEGGREGNDGEITNDQGLRRRIHHLGVMSLKTSTENASSDSI